MRVQTVTHCLLLFVAATPKAGAHFADEGSTIQEIRLRMESNGVRVVFRLLCDVKSTEKYLKRQEELARSDSLEAADGESEASRAEADLWELVRSFYEVRMGDPLADISRSRRWRDGVREKADTDQNGRVSFDELTAYIDQSPYEQYKLLQFARDSGVPGKIERQGSEILRNAEGKAMARFEMESFHPWPESIKRPFSLKVNSLLTTPASAAFFVLENACGIRSHTIPAADPFPDLTDPTCLDPFSELPKHRRAILHIGEPTQPPPSAQPAETAR